MSCVTLSIELYSPSTIMSGFKKKLDEKTMGSLAGQDVEYIYPLLEDYGYPGSIMKTELDFYFPGRKTHNPLYNMLSRLDPHILTMKISRIENLDVILAENNTVLKMSDMKDYIPTEEIMYVTDKDTAGLLTDMLKESRTRSRVITV